MKKIFVVGVMGFCFAFNAFADLPDWAKRSTRLAAFEQFVEWMQGSDFYRITAVETKEIKIDSGQEAVQVQLIFDDSKGCKGRTHTSICVPVDDKNMICQDLLDDCLPDGAKALRRDVSIE